jgi:putative oxidoreductase
MLAQSMERFTPYAPTILRLIVGIVFLFHGLEKFGDLSGFAGTLSGIGIPAPVVAVIEAVGGFFLIIGFLTRYVNVLHIILMIVAILTVKLSIGLIAPYDQPGVGYELDLLLLGASLVLLILGPGVPSVDKNVLPREF